MFAASGGSAAAGNAAAATNGAGNGAGGAPATNANPGGSWFSSFLPGRGNNNAPAGNAGTNNQQQEQQQQEQAAPVNPLDAFAPLLENASKAKAVPGSDFTPFQLDPNTLRDAVTKIQPPQLDPAMLQAMQAGDPQAYAQYAHAIQTHALTTALTLVTQMSNTLGQRTIGHVMDQIPGLVSQLGGTQHAMESMPQLQHPAMQPFVQMITQGMRASNPQATQGEISSAITGVFKAMATAFNPQQATNAQNSAGTEGTPSFMSWLQQDPGTKTPGQLPITDFGRM